MREWFPTDQDHRKVARAAYADAVLAGFVDREKAVPLDRQTDNCQRLPEEYPPASNQPLLTVLVAKTAP